MPFPAQSVLTYSVLGNGDIEVRHRSEFRSTPEGRAALDRRARNHGHVWTDHSGLPFLCGDGVYGPGYGQHARYGGPGGGGVGEHLVLHREHAAPGHRGLRGYLRGPVSGSKRATSLRELRLARAVFVPHRRADRHRLLSPFPLSLWAHGARAGGDPAGARIFPGPDFQLSSTGLCDDPGRFLSVVELCRGTHGDGHHRHGGQRVAQLHVHLRKLGGAGHGHCGRGVGDQRFHVSPVFPALRRVSQRAFPPAIWHPDEYRL